MVNLWLITVYSLPGLVGRFCQCAGLVTGLSLFIRPFLGKLPSYSCFYINQKCGPHYSAVWAPGIFFCWLLLCMKMWWIGLGKLPDLRKMSSLVSAEVILSKILFIHLNVLISAFLSPSIPVSFFLDVFYLIVPLHLTFCISSKAQHNYKDPQHQSDSSINILNKDNRYVNYIHLVIWCNKQCPCVKHREYVFTLKHADSNCHCTVSFLIVLVICCIHITKYHFS